MARDRPHCFVTGATGPTGSWVIKELLERGVDVTAFDGDDDDRRLRLVAPDVGRDRLQRAVGDVTDVAAVTSAMRGSSHVVHLHRSQSGGRRNPTETLHRAIGGGLAVIEAARRNGVRRLVYALPSATAHAAPRGTPTASPLLVAETLTAAAEQLWLTSGTPTIGVRIGAVYGPGQDEGWMAVLTRATAAAALGQPFVLRKDGDVSCHYIGDVAAALVDTIGDDRVEAAVVDLPGHRLSVGEFVSLLRAVTGTESVVVDREATDVDGSTPPATRTYRLDVEPTPLETGLRNTVEVFRWAPRDLFQG